MKNDQMIEAMAQAMAEDYIVACRKHHLKLPLSWEGMSEQQRDVIREFARMTMERWLR